SMKSSTRPFYPFQAEVPTGERISCDSKASEISSIGLIHTFTAPGPTCCLLRCMIFPLSKIR
ncbi:hypothetical protein JRQ81_004055, partial [Phrynocephalus forsythii]